MTAEPLTAEEAKLRREENPRLLEGFEKLPERFPAKILPDAGNFRGAGCVYKAKARGEVQVQRKN